MNFKKPKFWDKNKPNIYAYLLLPFALLVNLLSFLRVSRKKNKSKIKTICVGNIYIGGTGKTSLSIKISKILNERNIKTCFIKKNYKDQIDEQKILRQNGKLFLAKHRTEAIKLAEKEGYQYAIFDDGLQDNSIYYDVSFVCFNNINWIGNGMTIPSGPLRENINNLKKYEHICLNGNLENLSSIKDQILNINPKINIHVAKYVPTNLNEFNKNDKYLAFSGIGNHKTFVLMIKNYGLNILTDIEFPDHYKYSDKDIKNILTKAKNLNCKIITTEKDYLRFNKIDLDKIKFIKSELNFINEDKFIKSIIR